MVNGRLVVGICLLIFLFLGIVFSVILGYYYRAPRNIDDHQHEMAGESNRRRRSETSEDDFLELQYPSLVYQAQSWNNINAAIRGY